MADPTQHSYMGYYKPPVLPPQYRATGRPQRYGSITNAAAGVGASSPRDPFGLAEQAARSTGYQTGGGYMRPIQPRQPGRSAFPAAETAARPAAPAVNPLPAVNTAPGPTPYDLKTDPGLQQITALTGQSDEQARASALKQKTDELLGYGDPELIRKILHDETLATAAAGNPTSTLAQLGDQRHRSVHDLTEALNQANLLYSGYRVTQEGQAARDYEDALAHAAAGVNSNLGAIDSNLASALGQNQQQRVQGMIDAEGRHAQDAYLTGTGAGQATNLAGGGEPGGPVFGVQGGTGATNTLLPAAAAGGSAAPAQSDQLRKLLELAAAAASKTQPYSPANPG